MRSINQCRSLLIGMLMISCSGSMSSIIYAAGFDPTVDRAPAWQCSVVFGRIVFTMASGDTSAPCSSFDTGKLVELDAFSGKMLNHAVLDTNADGVVESNDTISSGVVFTGGIPTLVEKSGGSSRRIMWRQIQ